MLRDYCAVSGIGFERAMILSSDVIADFDAAVVRLCCEPVMSASRDGVRAGIEWCRGSAIRGDPTVASNLHTAGSAVCLPHSRRREDLP